MMKKIKLIIAIFLFLGGLVIFLYPVISDYLFKEEVEEKEKVFYESINIVIENANEEDEVKYNVFDSLNDLLTKENDKLFSSKQETFLNQTISFEKTLVDLEEYGLEGNVIGFLEIPSIKVKLPIYLGASSKNMKNGAVHLTGTSYPIGGVNTNSVIAAHRGHYKLKMFRDIDRISIGDILYIKNFNGIIEYKAVGIDVISPDELDKLVIQNGKDMVTLISCHPYPSNYQRYVVFFERDL